MITDNPLQRIGRIGGRSLFPIAALVVIGGSAIWGPFVSLLLAYGLWRVVGRVA